MTTLTEYGIEVDEVTLPEEIRGLSSGHGLIMSVEAAFGFENEYRENRGRLSESMRRIIEEDRNVATDDVQIFRRVQITCVLESDRLFDPYDAILTPTCFGEAEKGHAVGNNIFNKIWTAMHMQCLTIPSSTGPQELPVGVQLIGRRKLLDLAGQVSDWLLP